MKQNESKPPSWLVIGLYGAISANLALVHHWLIDAPHRAEQIAWYQAIIHGWGPAPDQYRIMTYGLAYLLIKIGLPFGIAFTLIRFVGLWISGLLFARFLQLWFSPWATLLGVLMLYASFPLTFLGYMMQPTDTLNLVFFLVSFLVIACEKDLWLFCLVPVAMLNRETPILIPLALVAARWETERWRGILWASLLFLLAASVFVGLRLVIGFRAPYTSLFKLWENLQSPWTYILPTILIGPYSLMATLHWSMKPPFLRRVFIVLLPAMLVVHMMVGLLAETRLLLPILPIAIALALFELIPESRPG